MKFASFNQKIPILISIAVLTTMGMGAWMRWYFFGAITLPIDFKHFRHAHSHLGYYAILFPLVWLSLKTTNILNSKVLLLYFLTAALSFFGFLQSGYGAIAIVGSTIIALIWLYSGWQLRTYLLQRSHPLALILPGIIFSEACIPPIAIYLRQDPVLASAFVTTFLSALLFMVFIPSALAAINFNFVPWPILLLTSALSSLYFGIWPNLFTQVGLGFFAIILLWGTARIQSLVLHLKIVWLLQSFGMLLLVFHIFPNNHFTGVGAIHFSILGPVLATLSQKWLSMQPPQWLWFLNYSFCALLSASLLAQGLGAGQGTTLLAAVAGTGIFLWWLTVLAWQTSTQRKRGIL